MLCVVMVAAIAMLMAVMMTVMMMFGPRPLLCGLPHQVAQLGQDELLHGQMTGVARAGENEDDLLSGDTRKGA